MAQPPTLNLLVLRAADVQASLRFYQALGLSFVQEQHGTGPVHFSCELGAMVIEIYPARARGGGAGAPDRRDAGATIVGFRVESLAAVIDALAREGAVVLTAPQDTPWGKRAVVSDPDGRAVELNEPAPQ